MELAEKLQLKPGHNVALVGPPDDVELDLGESAVSDQLSSAESRSARYRLNRDRLWEMLKGEGIKPVRQIAIDETWSALRFRPES